jgi:hypothetical protein
MINEAMSTKVIFTLLSVFIATATFGQDSLRIVGFNTSHADTEEQKAYLLKVAVEMKKENSVVQPHIYIADDGSFSRMYFPLSDAIIEYEGQRFTADAKGIVIAAIADPRKIKVVGRKKSEKVRGSSNDIITEDAILFKKELAPDVSEQPVTVGKNVVLFDFSNK